MALRDNRDGPVLHRHVRKVGADRQDVVVGVRVNLGILVPLHLVVGVIPFEVQVRVMERDVGPEEIRGHVRDNTLTEIPIAIVAVVDPLDPAQLRRLGRMPRR